MNNNNMTDIRKCLKCNVEKHSDDFYHRKDGGSHWQCKQCIQDKQKANRIRKKILISHKKVCIDCEKSKTKINFYEINGEFHDRCIKCCESVEYVCKGCNIIKDVSEF